jgi:alpha-galactosidase
LSARVVIVGGGSFHWAPRLLCDFANTPGLRDAHVVLHDLAPRRAARMAEFGTELARRAGIDLQVAAEPDRKAALAGAEYVITAFSVGGFDSMQHDLEIPARYGVVQPIGDSVGPGGIVRALRSIPVLLDIARDVERIAPDAWLLNVTNPLSALCRAVTRETSVRTVGLCNEWVSSSFVLSLLLDCGLHELDPVLAGVNHLPIATSMTVGGRDAFAELRDLLADPAAAEVSPLWMDPPPELGYEKVGPSDAWTKADVIANNAVRFEVFERFGVLPCSGDHHFTEFVPGFVHPATQREWRVHIYGLDRHRSDAAADVAHFDEIVASSEVPRIPSGELVAPLVESLHSGRRRELPVNIRNRGNVTNLDDGAIVEVMGVVGDGEVHGRDTTAIPGAIGEWVRRAHAVQELTVEAALTRRADLVLEAMSIDPLNGGLAYDDVVTMTDELLDATAPWLPAEWNRARR